MFKSPLWFNNYSTEIFKHRRIHLNKANKLSYVKFDKSARYGLVLMIANCSVAGSDVYISYTIQKFN